MSIPKKRLLVISPNENLWENDKSILFLGKWCTLYSKKEELKKIDYLIHKYHWNSNKKLLKVSNFLEKLYEEKLTDLINSLSTIHNLNQSSKYLDIGCAKGFLMSDLKNAIPELEVCGLDISTYAKDHAMENIKNDIITRKKVITGI